MALKLIYLDPGRAGHHIAHLELFLDRAIPDPRIESLHLALGAGLFERINAQARGLVEDSAKVSMEVVGPRVAGFRGGWFVWREARRMVESRPGSVCLINELDRPLPGAIIDRRRMPGFITGIVHSPRMRFSRRRLLASLPRGLVRTASFWLANKDSVPLIFSFDRYFVEKLPRFISRNWRYVPDPLPLTAEQQAELAAEPIPGHTGRLRLILFGSLGRRKGVYSLLAALKCMSLDERRRIEITIAGTFGEFTPKERERLPAQLEEAAALDGVSLRVVDRFLTDSELIDALRSSDVVLLPYVDHLGTSGVLLWAAAGGLPVIAPNIGWLGQVIEAEQLGFTCDTASAPELARTISQASQPGALDQFSSERIRRFCSGISRDQFYEGIISAIEDRTAKDDHDPATMDRASLT